MESNRASKYRNLSRMELRRLLAQRVLEDDDAPNARNPQAPSPTSTPRTFLFLGCLPMPLPSVVQQEVLHMVPTFFRKLMGWENCKAAPATKPAGPAGPKAKGFGGEIGKTTATEAFDAFLGALLMGRQFPSATKPAGSVDPNATGLGCETGKTAVSDNVFDAVSGALSEWEVDVYVLD